MEKLYKIVGEIFNVDAKNLDVNFNFQDLDSWDSMAYMYLVAKIEEDFTIQLSEAEIVRLFSINQIVDILKSHNKI